MIIVGSIGIMVMVAMALCPRGSEIQAAKECLGTPEFTHGELSAREGTCYVCGGYGRD